MTKWLLDLLILLSILSLLEGTTSFVVQPKNWDFRGHDIGFEVARKVLPSDSNTTGECLFDNKDFGQEPVLLLNGFGVGSFHQHRLIPKLLDSEDDNRVIYCVDYLGQGRSWPKDCQDGKSENENGLRYSAETWREQLVQFIEEVILTEQKKNGGPAKVHVVGNSVGGYLAAHLANARPDLVESLCLLNPTPVWGLNLPGWSGHLPAPVIPKAIGRYLFDRIRDLNTIRKYLENAYARPGAFNEELMDQIRGCTLGNGGHAAFASILWSPPLKVSAEEKGDFQQCLARLQCDVLLVFGKDDPWCKPAFAKKMLKALDSRAPGRVHRYLEIANAGHCPNHEAPQAVGKVIQAWTGAKDRSEGHLRLCSSESEVFQEPWGVTILEERHESDIKLGFVDWLAITFV